MIQYKKGVKITQWKSTFKKMIYLRVLTKPMPNDAKSPLPVDIRRSKTLLLKLPFLKTTLSVGPAGIWTRDLPLSRPALSQLK